MTYDTNINLPQVFGRGDGGAGVGGEGLEGVRVLEEVIEGGGIITPSWRIVMINM